LRTGHALLNFMPFRAVSRFEATPSRSRTKLARLKFQTASKSFDILNAAIAGIAAVQRGWRNFRMAQSSFERADPRCQKIGRRRLSRPARKNGGGFQ